MYLNRLFSKKQKCLDYLTKGISDKFTYYIILL